MKASQIRQAEDLRAATRAIACGRMVSERTIRRAETCPAGCSPARWRIELRRRAAARELAGAAKIARHVVVYPFNGKEAF